MGGAKGSIFVVCLIYLISLISAVEVCVLKSESSCLSAQYSFVKNGLSPGDAVRVSVELSPVATLEITNSAFQNIATLRFGSNSCSIESTISPIRAYSLYAEGSSYKTGSTVSFDIVAQEKSIGIYMAGKIIMEIPLLVAAPFALLSGNNNKAPSLQFIKYNSFKSNFCTLESSCTSSSLVSLPTGINNTLKITSALPSSIPDNYFSFFVSIYDNIYKLPILEIALSKEKWYVVSNGSFLGEGSISSNVVLGKELQIDLVPSGKENIEIKSNSESLGTFKIPPSSIGFIYQAVFQGTMTVKY